MPRGRSRKQPAEGPKVPLTPDWEEHLLVRAAWLAYVGGLTQDQVAQQLGLHRTRVNRMLAQAREQGIVQVTINAKIASCVALEGVLSERYGLKEAIVVPSPSDEALVPQTVAVAAGRALSDRLHEGMAVGIGWGRTLRLSMKSVPVRPIADLSVVALLGTLTEGSVLNAYESASRLADILDARCHYLAAPIFAESERTRDVFVNERILREAFAAARKVDLALVSVGSLDRGATMRRLGVLDDADITALRELGATGDLCAHFIDADGQLVDHPINRRVIGLAPADLAGIETVILASGGRDKAAVLRGALRLGVVDVLVTDEGAAEAILALG